MVKQLVSTIVFNENNQVLLMLRRDFRVWTLPGGRIDPGETPQEAAVRESQEETGYLIKIERQIGFYTRPQFQDTRYLFLGKIISGEA
ncbi:MAG: NUDIX hydrolase, partial [Chloroflexota bacterium]